MSELCEKLIIAFFLRKGSEINYKAKKKKDQKIKIPKYYDA